MDVCDEKSQVPARSPADHLAKARFRLRTVSSQSELSSRKPDGEHAISVSCISKPNDPTKLFSSRVALSQPAVTMSRFSPSVG